MIPAEMLTHEFLGYARDKLSQSLGQVVRCLRLLSSEEVWHRTNGHTNSVGNLVLHLTGNVRQWIVAGLGGQPFTRDRPAEFAQRGPVPTSEIVDNLERTVQQAVDVLQHLDSEALAARLNVQGYDVSALVAVFHVVEHFSAHTAQIVHMTKALKDVDLSLYDEHGRRLAGKSPTAGTEPGRYTPAS